MWVPKRLDLGFVQSIEPDWCFGEMPSAAGRPLSFNLQGSSMLGDHESIAYA